MSSAAVSPQKNLLLSATATAIAEVTTLPICTVKTRYQNAPVGTSVRNVVRDMYTKEGVRAFYRASGPAVVAQMFTTSCKFTMYRSLQSSGVSLGSNLYLNNVLYGCISGVLSSLITHPMDVMKIYLQMGKGIRSDFTRLGYSMFYRGYTKTMGKLFVGSSTFLPIYDSLLAHTQNPMLSSLGSAVLSVTLMQPFDYLKTRQLYGNTLNARQCFKGLHLNLFRVVPHFGITMCFIEWMKRIV